MENLPYLEGEDFNPDMSLKPHINQGNSCVIMLQSLGCGHCTHAKPAFMDFAKEANIMVATIQIDTEPELSKKLNQVDKSFQGIPTYWGFGKNGKYVKTHTGGRDKASLHTFANSLV